MDIHRELCAVVLAVRGYSGFDDMKNEPEGLMKHNAEE